MRQCLHVHHFGFLTLTVKTGNFETKLRRPSFELVDYVYSEEKKTVDKFRGIISYINFNVYKEMFIGFVLKYLDKMS